MKKRIVETSNFDHDYPNESFLLVPLDEADAKKICDAINQAMPSDFPRYWKVVPLDYKLQPAFEP